MNTKIPTILLAALALLGCGDDTTIIGTFNYTHGQITNITKGNMDSGGDDGVPTDDSGGSTGDTTGEPSGMSETTVPGSTSGSGDTEQVDPTTTGADTDPVQDPPFGCGVIVESLLNVPVEQRYIVADVSACIRPQEIAAAMLMFKTMEKASSTVAVTKPCVVFGGSGSAVAGSIGFQQADLALASSDVSSFGLDLFVDDVLTDSVRVSAILKGQVWQNMPSAPDQPMHRAEDFSWRVLPQHLPGCVLFVD